MPKAAVCEGVDQPMQVIDVDVDAPKSGEVRVRARTDQQALPPAGARYTRELTACGGCRCARRLGQRQRNHAVGRRVRALMKGLAQGFALQHPCGGLRGRC